MRKRSKEFYYSHHFGSHPQDFTDCCYKTKTFMTTTMRLLKGEEGGRRKDPYFRGATRTGPPKLIYSRGMRVLAASHLRPHLLNYDHGGGNLFLSAHNKVPQNKRVTINGVSTGSMENIDQYLINWWLLKTCGSFGLDLILESPVKMCSKLFVYCLIKWLIIPP